MSAYTQYEDDPMLTAYVLGELEAEEAAAVEARLADDPAAREFVEQIRAAAGALAAAFKAEGNSPAMTVERSNQSRRGRWAVALAAAATIAAVGVTTFVMMPSLNRAREASPRLAMTQSPAEDAAAGREKWETYDRSGGAGAAGGEAGPTIIIQREEESAVRPLLEPSTAPPADGEADGEVDRTLAAVEQAQRRAEDKLAKPNPSPEAASELDSAVGDMAQAGPMPSQTQGQAPSRRSQQARPEGLAEGMRGGGVAGEAAGPPFQRPASPAASPPLFREGWLDDALGEGRNRQDFHTEAYDRIADNEFKRVAEHPLSTFSVDVDTASYANVRRFLQNGQLPPPDAVRIEEMVNYFDYDYAPPTGDSAEPFTADVQIAAAPWNPDHRLVRIGLKGYEVPDEQRKPTNLVFLLDVSGSMNQPNKLPLVKESMKMLVDKLDGRDNVAIAVYAGSSGLVLPATSASNKESIKNAIDQLHAGGSTNGAEGIQLAYDTARKGFIEDGVNRVILATDGDFNIGVTDRGQLTRLIEEQAKSGVYLSILGFGMGNLKDAAMEELTNKGEGNYAYIDTESEARKVLVEQMAGTLEAIAKDVKIQVEFNPAEVASYRLIGYENRILAKEDFNDDTKDAGDIGAGHQVTALYEVVPASVAPQEIEQQITTLREEKAKLENMLSRGLLTPVGQEKTKARIAAIDERIEALGKLPEAKPHVDDLRYQEDAPAAPAAASGELLTVKLRYKAPDAEKEQGASKLLEFPVKDEGKTFEQADADFQLAASVAGFGMLLRDSPYKGTLTWQGLEEMTKNLENLRWKLLSLEGSRALEFRDLVLKAKALAPAEK